MNEQLQTYLCEMIGTPEAIGFYVPDISAFCQFGHGDGSFPGLLVEGTPTPEQAKELMRVLLPGGHLLLVAPDDAATGHTGACVIEDAGFEIRDAILWAHDGGNLHYVPKAGRRERETGCGNLKGKAGHEAVERKPDTAGLDNPRAGAGRTADTVKNFHPTVKPIEVMERLLADVPKDGAVLDPFMGSGTTGIACTRTGHDFVGIEMSEEYLEIADTRIRHWNQVGHNETLGGVGAPNAAIESDHERPPKEETETEPEGLFGLFGFGDE